MNPRFVRTGIAAALCLSPLATPVAHAQNGLQLLEQDWDPVLQQIKSITSFKNKSFLSQVGHSLWEQGRPIVESKLIEVLGQKGMIVSGQNAYDIQLHLAPTGTVSTSTDGVGHVAFTIALKGNSTTLTMTQPFVGKPADPRVSVNFDIEIEVVLDIPSDLSAIHVARGADGKELATVRIVNAHLDSQNLPADVAKDLVQFVSEVSKVLGGPDFWARIEEQLDPKIPFGALVDPLLEPVNSALGQLKGRGYSILTLARTLLAQEGPQATRVASSAFFPMQSAAAPSITLMAYRTEYPVPVVGSGVLRGTIRWDKALGQPSPQAAYARRSSRHVRSIRTSTGTIWGRATPFVFQAQVQSGLSRPGQITVPTRAITRPAYGEVVETSRGYEFRYEVFGLPNDVPLGEPSMVVARDVDWASINPQPLPPKVARVQPDGWEGVLRIHPSKGLRDLRAVPLRSLQLREGGEVVRPRKGGTRRSEAPAEGVRMPLPIVCAAPQRPRRPGSDRLPPAGRPGAVLHSRSNPEGDGILDSIDFVLTLEARSVIK